MTQKSVNPIELAIFQSGVHSIAEEMGAALRRRRGLCIRFRSSRRKARL